MSDLKKAIAIQGLLIGILWIAVALYYPHLPDRVASHFGATGTPDGWMSKRAFAAFSLAFAPAIAVLMIAVQAVTTAMVRLPTSLINMPNKRYWLAPERRDETLAVLAPLISRLMFVTGTATTALIVVDLIVTFRTNLSPQPNLRGAFPLVLLYLALVIGWSIRMTVRIYRRFGRIPADSPAE